MAGAVTADDIRLTTPVSALPGVAARLAQRFARLGIERVGDLLRHLPMRYEREHAEGAIADLPMEAIGSARGTLVRTRWVSAGGRGKGRFQATLQDHSETLSLVWFNAGYLRNKLAPGMTIRVQGKVRAYSGYPQMVNPTWEELENTKTAPAKAERLRPIYPATEDLSSDAIERVVADVLPRVLEQIKDPLPATFVADHAMPKLADAFRMVHQPEHEDEAAAARRRLAFNELLLLQLGIEIKRHYNRTALVAPALRFSKAIDEHIRARFPFALTESQDQVVAEIAADLQRDRPMNRLVQGDVGSGKTVVALYALLLAVADRKQGAMMAPTELLAEQHHMSITDMLAGSNVRLALLTGSVKSAARAELLERIAAGQVDIVIGTHALLTEHVRFHDLAVAVVDEQHRFGVMQRAKLRAPDKATSGKNTASLGATDSERSESSVPSAEPSAAGTTAQPEAAALSVAPDEQSAIPNPQPPTPNPSPHFLVMTATPIPRTLSLTVFGDLDVSTIRGLPPGRTPITTRVVGPDKADEVYRYLADRLKRGEQAYVVVPTIDDTGKESATQLKNVRAHAKLLADKFCRGYKVEAIHGRLKRETREAIMGRFREGKVHVLVATTVIEVGVDVPNASVMVVEHAERFGLSQLHQLRGRIGRGTKGRKALCVFIADPTTDDATQRIAAVGATGDGFKIAEADLQIRGMGDFFGTRQHGLPPLRVANIPDDMPLLQLAKRDAQTIIDEDPMLADPSRELLRKVLLREYGETLGLIDVG